MKASFIFFFFLFGLLQFGILVNAWLAYQGRYRLQSLQYWSIALAMSAMGYWSFATALTVSDHPLGRDSVLITLANTLIFGSVLCQGMFPRALRRDVSPRIFWFILGLILIYGVIFESLRPSSFEKRTILVAVVLFIIYIWQSTEIWVTRQHIKSVHLNLLVGIVFAEAFCNLARALAVYASSVQILSLDQLPALVSLFLWTQITLNVLAYITMTGFWVREMTAQNVAAEYENTKIRELLEEKDNLLQNLVKTKKIAELGAMSASISHEINQPLAAIKLNAWSLKKTHEQDANLTAMQSTLIDQTVKDIDRVAEIVATLRSIFKTRHSAASVFDLADFIEGLRPLIEAELKTRMIRMDYQIPPSAKVIFNESELTLVLLNIVNNAANAESKAITISARSDYGRVEVMIADDGRGVPDRLVPYLFEFGKPTEGRGLGLGLWLSKYVMERSDGGISYAPRSPKGSVFTITMPSAD